MDPGYHNPNAWEQSIPQSSGKKNPPWGVSGADTPAVVQRPVILMKPQQSDSRRHNRDSENPPPSASTAASHISAAQAPRSLARQAPQVLHKAATVAGQLDRGADFGEKSAPAVDDTDEEQWPSIQTAMAQQSSSSASSRQGSPAKLAPGTANRNVGTESTFKSAAASLKKQDVAGGPNTSVGSDNRDYYHHSKPPVKPLASTMSASQLYSAGKDSELTGGRAGYRVAPSVPLISEQLVWLDHAKDLFTSDNCDFLVIGCVGPQGSGKSTLLSMLAGNDPNDMYRQYAFRPASREAVESGRHQTAGAHVTCAPDRIVFIDTQPSLSLSLLDDWLRADRRYMTPGSGVTPGAGDGKSLENQIEMESLQMLAFLAQVAHVLLISIDWFIDPAIIQLLRQADLLRLTKSELNHEGLQLTDRAPVIAFVQQRGRFEDFDPMTYKKRCEFLQRALADTQYTFHSGINLARSSITPFSGLHAARESGQKDGKSWTDVNYFVLSEMKLRQVNQPKPVPTAPTWKQYNGVPEYSSLISELRHLIRAQPLISLSDVESGQPVLSERMWFNAGKSVWDALNKSTSMVEFSKCLAKAL